MGGGRAQVEVYGLGYLGIQVAGHDVALQKAIVIGNAAVTAHSGHLQGQ